MAFNNQGSRPNYQSSIAPLTYIRNKATLTGNAGSDNERIAKHETWVGGAFLDLSEVTERQFSCTQNVYLVTDDRGIVDFEQPRALYQKVMGDVDRDHLVSNIASSLGGVKNAEIKARSREYPFVFGVSSLTAMCSGILRLCRPVPVRSYRCGNWLRHSEAAPSQACFRSSPVQGPTFCMRSLYFMSLLP